MYVCSLLPCVVFSCELNKQPAAGFCMDVFFQSKLFKRFFFAKFEYFLRQARERFLFSYYNKKLNKMRPTNGRLWGTLCEDQIEIRSCTKDKLKESLDVLYDSFFINESVCVATKINLPENVQARQELRELCRITAEDGVSLIALEKSTGKPIAVAFNKIQFIPDNGEDVFFLKFRKENTESPNAQSLMDFMIDVDSEVDIFDKFNLDCTCELMFLATLPQWERQGIAKALTKYTIDLTKELKEGKGLEELHPSIRSRRPQAVTAIFTSKYSQKVGQAEQFHVVNTVPYTKFTFEGKTYDQRINALHKYCEHVVYLV